MELSGKLKLLSLQAQKRRADRFTKSAQRQMAMLENAAKMGVKVGLSPVEPVTKPVVKETKGIVQTVRRSLGV